MGLNKESAGLIISSSREVLYAHETAEDPIDMSKGLLASKRVAVNTKNVINKIIKNL